MLGIWQENKQKNELGSDTEVKINTDIKIF
jgi:hypothetical protein